MKLPFGRKQQANDEVPTEIKQYYTEEARDRKGATWLTAVLVFFATVAVVLGLFYGGRALYRALFADDNPAPQTTQQEGNRSQGDVEIGNPDTTPNTNNDTDESGQNGADTPDRTPGNQSDEEETTPTTPNTGAGDVEEIPATGPDVFF